MKKRLYVKKENMIVIVLALLVGAMAVGGVLGIWPFHSANAFAKTAPLADPDPVKMVSYSCSGGSVAEQSFYFSLQKEDGKILFSCDYFGKDHGSGDWEKFVVEDVELPAESFTELMRLVANVSFPDECKKADDEVIILDAETHSLTVYYVSGKRRSLEKHFAISEIEGFFREIKIKDEWKINYK